MKTEKPLVDKDYILETIGDGKVNWTIAQIPDIPMSKRAFGMSEVRGKIDDHEFSGLNLMPLGNGNLFLPAKAAVRKKIRKQAGDTVHITLYEDKTPLRIPEDLLVCMQEEGLFQRFAAYSKGQQKAFIDWIDSAKTDKTRIDRIARTIVMVSNGEKFY